MTGRVTVLTPTDKSEAVELGRKLYRKRVLPIGELDYKGRRLIFDRAYNDSLAAAFRDGAFDTVPFQLAGDDNAHTNAVDRSGGDIIGLESTDDGLWSTISATEKGAAIIDEHPDLPVSVRVVEGYTRSDGKSTREYPAALQHVLGTWAPRISGMGRWQPVDCAEETDEVIDLSALTFTPDGDAKQEIQTPAAPSGVSEVSTDQEGGPMVPISDEMKVHLEALRPLFAELDKKPEPEAVKAEVAPQSPAFVEAPVASEVEPEVVKVEEPVLVSAAEDNTDNSVELALVEMRTVSDRQAIELAELKAERDAREWKHESASLVRDYGIPPAIVSLCEPLLKGSKHVVELSEGSVDAGDILRQVLTTVAKTYGRRVDLSGPIGTSQELSASDLEATERSEFLARQHAAGFGK
jgi:hypothetical protein